MELFDLVKCLDPSQFTMTLPPREFVNTYLPAYGDTWDDARDLLLNCPADRIIISELTRQYKRDHKFRETPKVNLPQCDLEDREEEQGQLANGMHRIAVLRAMGRPIEFSFYYPYLPNEDEWTEVELTFHDKIADDEDLFGWLRSIPLDNGEWIECCMGTQDGYVFSLYLDRVSDHKLLLKKLHELATLDDFTKYGLLSINIQDKSE